jgi:dTDP-4-dehydrorhamnose 3,5-epimerase
MPVRLFTTRRFGDARGWFAETYNVRRFAAAGLDIQFVQDNQSSSKAAMTLRGIHFQKPPHAQAKLVRCLRGRIFDIAVDLRPQSPTFRAWIGVELSAEGGEQLFVPAGFGHAYLTLEPDCEVAYKVDEYYEPASESGIRWDDPQLAIAWPLDGRAPILSDKDSALPPLEGSVLDFPNDGAPFGDLVPHAL